MSGEKLYAGVRMYALGKASGAIGRDAFASLLVAPPDFASEAAFVRHATAPTNSSVYFL